MDDVSDHVCVHRLRHISWSDVVGLSLYVNRTYVPVKGTSERIQIDIPLPINVTIEKGERNEEERLKWRRNDLSVVDGKGEGVGQHRM